MGIVHRHKRRTASGKVTTVRQHTRDTGGSDGDERRPAADDAALPPRAAALPDPAPRDEAETWWDDDEPRREPWMDTGADEVEYEGHTFKVNPAPPLPRPQGDYDFASPQAGRHAAVARYKAAREALGNYYCDEEDDEYHRLNDAVLAAERDLPWWRRW